ncbi:MAG TPA: HRDC domain-containing protein [Candidatus Sulfomarinibacteraceae bacterium]|nr:HRDC domain-containing protein [Candidatus Sulfomarinibacteraceae bacterium]
MSNGKRKQRSGKPDLPPYRHVRSAAAWTRCLRRLQVEPRIAVDLEANSMYAYQEQVCLIQISIPGQDYIVDPLADIDLGQFGALIEDESVEKVFHAAEYDLILMKREFGWELRNLFDTMWAARILGYERIGLANILEDIYQVSLNKRFQRANWCKRPLSKAQLAYAQADTHYLLGLRDYFAEALEQAGRMVEAQEIFAEQSIIAVPDISFDPDGFWSINGVHRLPAHSKAALQALYLYRDKEARRRDQPHFKILHDKTLLELAQELPEHKGALQNVRGMSRGQISRYGDEILRIVRETRDAPAPRRPRQPPRPPEDVLGRYERLHTWRKERGQARGVESDVIVSRDALWEIARLNPQTREELARVQNLGPWRLEEYGDEILSVLAEGR